MHEKGTLAEIVPWRLLKRISGLSLPPLTKTSVITSRQATGRDTYGDIGKGYRVIELYEGQRKIDTWLRIKYNADRDKNLWEPTKKSE